MPNFDQTGPCGKGPKTGRGMGKCNGQGNMRGLLQEVEDLKSRLDKLENSK